MGMDAISVTDTVGAQGFQKRRLQLLRMTSNDLWGWGEFKFEECEPIILTPSHETLMLNLWSLDVRRLVISSLWQGDWIHQPPKWLKGMWIAEFSEFIDPVSLESNNSRFDVDYRWHGARFKTEKASLWRIPWILRRRSLVGHNVTFDMGFMQGVCLSSISTNYKLSHWYVDFMARLVPKTCGHIVEYLLPRILALFWTTPPCHLWLGNNGSFEPRFLWSKRVKSMALSMRINLNDHMMDNDAWRHGRPNHARLC